LTDRFLKYSVDKCFGSFLAESFDREIVELSPFIVAIASAAIKLAQKKLNDSNSRINRVNIVYFSYARKRGLLSARYSNISHSISQFVDLRARLCSFSFLVLSHYAKWWRNEYTKYGNVENCNGMRRDALLQFAKKWIGLSSWKKFHLFVKRSK